MKMSAGVYVFFLLSAILAIFAEECKDADRESKMGLCKQWKEAGMCITHKTQIGPYCKKTCGFCTGPTLAPGQTHPPHTGGCGKPEIQGIRVIAGKDAVRGSWPWQVLLMYGGQAMCGGTLVAPEYVVTAAHCVYGREQSNAFTVRVGEHDRNIEEGSEVDVRVIQVLRHQLYNPWRLNNDIAVLYLERPVKFTKYVSPICLPKAEVPPGSKCYITGWGKIRHPGIMTSILQQAMLPVVSNQVCYEFNKDRIHMPVTDAMICGGYGGKAPQSGCHGDSGGPYVCEVNGVWELHGSVSYGSPSCDPREMYTVFSRTYHFLDWIKAILNR